MAEKHKNRKGFTLIELLVSMVVFVLIMGIVGSSFVSIVRAQKAANEIRRMYSEVRGFTDLLAEEARLGAIDYECYSTVISFSNSCPQVIGSLVNGRTTDLALVGVDGMRKTIFRYDPKQKRVFIVKYEKTAGGGWKLASGYTDFRAVTGETVSVERLVFAINPDVDPYAQANYGLNRKQFQPKVTLFMNVAKGGGADSDFNLDFQTTISSRVYNR